MLHFVAILWAWKYSSSLESLWHGRHYGRKLIDVACSVQELIEFMETGADGNKQHFREP